VRGPLNESRSRQGHPVLFQAGSSRDGIAFASRFAEAVYTAQQTLGEAQAFHRTLKGEVARHGRDPDHIKILPGIVTIIGDTEEAAQARYRDLLEGQITEEAILATGKQLGGIDLSQFDLDDRLPPEALPTVLSVEGRQSRYGVFRQLAVEERWTVRQLIELQLTAAGHGRAIGTPEQVADRIGSWFLEGGCDGFVAMPAQGLGGAELFAAEVVPLLQRRGLFREDYQSDTLRGHLGLPRPVSRYAATRHGADVTERLASSV
jgi:alkanesulfonate monooxygenase SsuD/methylene tetrahydromethanopterin reductase-like flavin-dependent oxidoreductase (luciferase family)